MSSETEVLRRLKPRQAVSKQANDRLEVHNRVMYYNTHIHH